MCRCRHTHDVNVEVSEDVVAVVEKFMVDVVLVVVGGARGAKNCTICMTDMQLMTFCT
jgi:hypothetical protein